MKIVLLNIGKPHDVLLNEAITNFTKRIQKYATCSWQILPAVKNAGVLQDSILKKAEAESFLQQLLPTDYIILLDETGKQLSSTQLATHIQQQAISSYKRLVFIIGGAFGVHESIQQKAHFTWSLSKLVFPHMLVRLILAEQLYRAYTILNNEKYHHV
jgi:23S rRNA (pseudouridine1915-N3)-methyltransferase